MRADRLLSIMLKLQAVESLTAADLAEQLEVSERTIYRDIEALGIAGIPVYTVPGVNGGVFMDPNYRVSLTGLTRNEIQSLFVSAAHGPAQDLGLGQAVEESLLKILAALPTVHREEAERMRQRIFIDPIDWFQAVKPLPFLSALQEAVWDSRILQVDYHKIGGAPEERILMPYGLVYKANTWYLVAQKPDGHWRTYRVSRMISVRVTDEIFERDLAFDLHGYWKETTERFEREARENNPPYWVTFRAHDDAMWYFESIMDGSHEELEARDNGGWRTLKRFFYSAGDARQRLLGLGSSVQVLEPANLRNAIKESARALLMAYGD